MAKDPVLDREMLWLSDTDVLDFRALIEGGTLITGGLGSGKSSSSARALALSFLQAGMGGLVLTVKSDETDHWREYAMQTGREDDLIIFNAESGLRFDPLAYAWKNFGRTGAFTETIVELFTLLMSVGKAYTPSSGERYFEQAVEELIRATVVLLSTANRPISILSLHEAITSLPDAADQYKNPDWLNSSIAGKLLLELKQASGKFSLGQQGDLDTALVYLFEKWPALDPRTKSNIESTWSGLSSKMTYSPFRELFSSGSYDFTPSQTTHEHKIVVVDMPVLEFGKEASRLCQILIKIIFERAWAKHQYKTGCCHGAFEFQDEFEMLLHRDASAWHSICRSNAIAPVMITPNIMALAAQEFGEQQPGSKTLGFLGLLSVKIAHANNDVSTNQFFADQIGKHWRYVTGFNASEGGQHSHAGVSGSQQLVHILEPQEFTKLARPDGSNPVAGTIVYVNGRTFNATKSDKNPNGLNYLRVGFSRE